MLLDPVGITPAHPGKQHGVLKQGFYVRKRVFIVTQKEFKMVSETMLLVYLNVYQITKFGIRDNIFQTVLNFSGRLLTLLRAVHDLH